MREPGQRRFEACREQLVQSSRLVDVAEGGTATQLDQCRRLRFKTIELTFERAAIGEHQQQGEK